MKKTLALLVSAMLTMSLLASCGGNTPAPSPAYPDQSSEKQVVTWVTFQDTADTQQKIVDAFEAQNPDIEIDMQEVPGNSDDVKKGLITSLAAGQDDPDVFNMDVIWTTQFASAGWLADQTATIQESDFLAGPLSTVKWQDKYWAYPMYTDVQLFYYRSDLLPNPPKTWDEMVAMSKEHIGKNGIEYGLLYQAFQGEPIVCNALTFIKSNGGNDIVDGKTVIDSPNSVEALKFMRQLIDDKISPEDVLTHKPPQSVAVYEQGKALFMIAWPASFNSMNTNPTSLIQGKFNVTSMPVGPSGNEPGPTVGGWNLAVNSKSDVPDAANKFAQFVTGIEGQTIRTLGTSVLPTREAIYADPDIKSQCPEFEQVMSSVDYAKSRPSAPDYPTMSTAIAANLHKALSQTVPYEEALKILEAEMDKLISK